MQFIDEDRRMKYINLLAMTMLFPAIVSAQPLEVGTPITANVIIQNPVTHQIKKKTVQLINYRFTEAQLQAFYNVKNLKNGFAAPVPGLKTRVRLGMNKTPVLDQGRHGTCATFSNTAAIDALIKKGDYVSQLCSLELGSYLARDGYYPSGWDGSNGPIILNQLVTFGIVSTETQKTAGCAGVTEYPLDGSSKGAAMSIEEYKQKGEAISSKITWADILTVHRRFHWRTKADGDTALNNIKTALSAEGSKLSTRVTLGFLVPVQYCSVGACGTFHQKYDTWTLSEKLANDQRPQLAGHEVVIMGYNDNAVITDDEGVKHTGILIIRNSWGREAGNKGNYYMSYDYFKKFVMEIQKISLKA